MIRFTDSDYQFSISSNSSNTFWQSLWVRASEVLLYVKLKLRCWVPNCKYAWTRGHSLSFNTSHWPILSISHLRDKIIHINIHYIYCHYHGCFYFISFKCNNNQRDCDVFIPAGCHLYFLFRNPHVHVHAICIQLLRVFILCRVSYNYKNITFYRPFIYLQIRVHDCIADQHEDWFYMQYTTSCDLGGFPQISCISITIHLREKL